MKEIAAQGVRVEEVERKGEPLKEIVDEAGKGYTLMVSGTHGVQTLKQELLGSDMLRMVRRSPIPTLVVQLHTARTAGLMRILMPVAGHEDITPLLNAVSMLAKLQGSEVIIYQQLTEGESTDNALLINKVKMVDRLKQEGIPYREANEPVGDCYKGFAERTLRYARNNDVDCIAIMAKECQPPHRGRGQAGTADQQDRDTGAVRGVAAFMCPCADVHAGTWPQSNPISICFPGL